MATAGGGRVTSVHRDVNVSGLGELGPGLHKLLETVQRGDVDFVVVGDMSRLGRSASAVERVLATVIRHGSRVVTVEELQ